MAPIFHDTGGTWSIWTGPGTGSTATCTSHEDIWDYWTDSTPTTTVTDTHIVWGCWSQEKALNSRSAEDQREINAYIAEQARLAEEGRREHFRRAEEAHKRREKANAIAKKLFLSMLNNTQRKQYKKDRIIEVISKTSRKRYRIRDNTLNHNIEELNKQGDVIRRICAHPQGVPLHDALLTQKLMLENNEDDLLRIANFS